MENVNLRHTDVLLGLKCPSCGTILSLFPGRTQITFLCKAGHMFPMRQLFQMQAQDTNRGLRQILEIWEEKVAALKRSAEIARREGRMELAQNFLRELDSVESRIRVVRDHLEEMSKESSSGSMAG